MKTVVIGYSRCPHCNTLTKMLNKHNINHAYYVADKNKLLATTNINQKDYEACVAGAMTFLKQKGIRAVPQTFVFDSENNITNLFPGADPQIPPQLKMLRNTTNMEEAHVIPINNKEEEE